MLTKLIQNPNYIRCDGAAFKSMDILYLSKDYWNLQWVSVGKGNASVSRKWNLNKWECLVGTGRAIFEKDDTGETFIGWYYITF